MSQHVIAASEGHSGDCCYIPDGRTMYRRGGAGSEAFGHYAMGHSGAITREAAGAIIEMHVWGNAMPQWDDGCTRA